MEMPKLPAIPAEALKPANPPLPENDFRTDFSENPSVSKGYDKKSAGVAGQLHRLLTKSIDN